MSETLEKILSDNNIIIRQQVDPDSIGPDPLTGRLDAIAQYAYDYSNTATKSLNDALALTVHQVRLLSNTEPSQVVTTDLGGGTWVRDDTDTTSADNTGTILKTASNKRYKRVYDGPIFADWFGAVGDGITDDTASLQKALTEAPDFSTVSFSSEKTYSVSTLVVPNKRGLTLTSNGAVINGTLQIGSLLEMDPAFDFNIKVEGLYFDLSVGNSLAKNAISVSNAQNVFIERCSFKGADKCIYIPPINKMHVLRLKATGNSTVPDTSLPANSRGSNYFLYVDNVSKGTPSSVTDVVADISITGNLNIQCNISNVVGWGLDGISIQNNTFFLPGGFFKSQQKLHNIFLTGVTWLHISDNNLFEAGYESILINIGTAFNIVDNNIAWPGQRDVTRGDAIRITGGGYKELAYSKGVISGNVIDLPSKNGIRLDSGTNYVVVDGNHICSAGNVGHYYGTGTYPMGDPNNTPLINSVSHYAISNHSSNLQCLVTDNQCNENDYDFPVDTAVSEYKRSRHFNNLGVAGPTEVKGAVITDLTSGIVDASNLSSVFLNVTAGGTINSITGGDIGALLFIYNGSNTVILTNNSTTMQLSGNANATIPFRGGITLRRSFGVWTEVSRTFTPNTLLLNAGDALASIDPIGEFRQNNGYVRIVNGSSSSSAFLPVVRGKANGIDTFGVALVGTGADSYSQASVVLRGSRADGAGMVTSGKVLSFQNYTTELGYIDVNGNMKLNSVSATIDFGSVPAQQELAAPSTVTFTGASVGDRVHVAFPNTAGIVYKCSVTATNTITIWACNFTASAIDPPSGTFVFSIMKS